MSLAKLSNPRALQKMSSVEISFAYSFSSAAAYTIADKHGRKALLRLFTAYNSEKISGIGAQARRPGRAQDAQEVAEDARERSRRLRVRALEVLSALLACSGDARASRGRDDPRPPGAARGRPDAGAVEILDARWCRPIAPEELTLRGAGPPGRAARAPRQVPGLGALRRRVPAHAPAHDRDAAARPGAGAAPHARADRPRRPHAGLRRPAPLRHRRAGARAGGARRVLRRAARRRAARARVHRRAPVRAGADLARAGQGVPARPEARRRRRQHLRRRGAVPRPRASAATGQPADPRAVRGDPRRGRRVADGRPGGQGRDDRRLPRPLRGQRQLPGPVPRSPARARAVPELRQPGAQAARGRAGDLRLRALPTTAARAQAEPRLRPRRRTPSDHRSCRTRRAPGSRRCSRRR